MPVTDDVDALGKLGLRGASPVIVNSPLPRWYRMAFGAGVCVTVAVVVLTLVVVIPWVVSTLATIVGALPALVSG